MSLVYPLAYYVPAWLFLFWLFKVRNENVMLEIVGWHTLSVDILEVLARQPAKTFSLKLKGP